MKILLVLLVSVAVASSSPTIGFLSHALGGAGGAGGGAGKFLGGPHGHGGVPGGIGGVAVPGGAGGNGAGHVLGSIFGGARPGGRTDRGFRQEGGVYPVGGGGLFQVLGFLGQGLTDVAGNAGSILDDIVHLRIPAILDDGFNAVISVGRGLGGIINAIFPGLGSLLGNLVVSIGKILICLLGSPGLSGSILGDRRPGRDNPRDIPYICTPDYGRDWGCSYDGPYDNPTTIIKHYHVGNAKQQAQDFVDKATNGQGVDSLTGSRKIIATRIIIIANIMDQGSDKWSDDDIATLMINIMIINAVVGESYQPGLGRQIINEWVITLKKNNKNQKFPDVSKYRQQMIDALNGSEEDQWEGAFDQKKRGDWSKIKRDDSDNQSDDTNTNKESGNDNSNDNESTKNNNKNTNKNTENNNSNDNESTKNNNKNTNKNTENNNSNDNESTKNNNKNTNKNTENNNSNDNESTKNNNKNTNKNTENNNSNDNESTKNNNKNTNKNTENNNSNVNEITKNNNKNTNRVTDSDNSNDNDKKSSSGGDFSNGDDGSTTLRERNASSIGSQNTDEHARSKNSSGSGKSVKNADGSSMSEYNFSNGESESSKKTSSSHDDRSHELEYTHNSD